MAEQFQSTSVDGFTVGRVFTRALATIAADPGAALGIAFLFGGLPLIGYHYLDHSYSATATMTNGRTALSVGFGLLLFGLGLVLLNTVIGTVSEGGFVRLVVARNVGQSARFADAAASGVGALLIPGIILMLMWSVAGPVLVAERCGVLAALGRSRVLTEGARGGIFVVGLLVGVVTIAANALVDRIASGVYGAEALTRMFGQGFPISYLLMTLVADSLVVAFSAAVYSAVYVELCNWKDGAPTDALAEVFA